MKKMTLDDLIAELTDRAIFQAKAKNNLTKSDVLYKFRDWVETNRAALEAGMVRPLGKDNCERYAKSLGVAAEFVDKEAKDER